MVFEPLHPRLELQNLSPLRRVLAALLGLTLLALFVWCGVIAHNAKPLDEPGAQKPVHVRAGAQHPA